MLAYITKNKYIFALSLCPVYPHHALDRERVTVTTVVHMYVLLGTILCSGEGSSQLALAHADGICFLLHMPTSVSNEHMQRKLVLLETILCSEELLSGFLHAG